MCQGLTNPEIGQALVLSASGVENRVNRLYRYFDADGTKRLWLIRQIQDYLANEGQNESKNG